MGCSLVMHIDQPPSDVPKLRNNTIIRRTKVEVVNERHTSSNRSALMFAFTKSLMFPFAIHSDTIANRYSAIVAPNSGSTFGWRRVLHTTTSLQNLYETQLVIDGYNRSRAPPATHSFDPPGVILCVGPQNLDCDLPALIPSLPYV